MDWERNARALPAARLCRGAERLAEKKLSAASKDGCPLYQSRRRSGDSG